MGLWRLTLVLSGKAMLPVLGALSIVACTPRVEVAKTFPPLADIKPALEPAYPVEALQPGDAGEAAEKAWWNSVLIWGRGEHDKVVRVCGWARDLKMPLPAAYCAP